MTLTDENQTDTVHQATEHAMLIPWGRFARHLDLSKRLRAAVCLRRHKDAAPGGDLVLEFGLASLAGYEQLQDLNLGSHPLAKDQAVQDEWDIEFRHYTTVSRFLYALDGTNVAQVQAVLDDIMQPYIDRMVHEVLCHQPCLTLCSDLTGRPVSAYSSTYPPDAVFGYMANQVRRGHQAVLVTLKGLERRVHIATMHHAGNTVSKGCLHESVETTEARLGCRPRRRTELVRKRIAIVESKIARQKCLVEAQQSVLRYQTERQIRLGNQLQAIEPRLVELKARYEGKVVRRNSKLAQVRVQKGRWQRQLQSALNKQAYAQGILYRHRQRLEQLAAERDTLVNWLAQLEVDNATNPNPVQMRWLLDGGFGDAENVTYMIEMGYDFYTIAHNGMSTLALRKKVPHNARWIQAGTRTQALDMTHRTLGDCPYPLRLTLLRWKDKDAFKYCTLVSFSEQDTLPTADLFPTYHQRQDVEAGIKQGKGTFSFTKLHVRSSAGIQLLGQFALLFWPNFVRWAADWLANQIHDDTHRFTKVLRQVRTQVRVAANTPAVVMTNASGQLLEFSANGPYAGVYIRLDGPFVYQFPMPLFKAGQLQWPISSESVKEHLSAMIADRNTVSLAGLLTNQLDVALPEKVPKN